MPCACLSPYQGEPEEEVLTVRVDAHSRGRDVCGDGEVGDPQVLQGDGRTQRAFLPHRQPSTLQVWRLEGMREVPAWGGHLDLPVLEDATDAAVKAGPREHGRDRVGQVQHGLHHRRHVLSGQGTHETAAEDEGFTLPTCWHGQWMIPWDPAGSPNLGREQGPSTRVCFP